MTNPITIKSKYDLPCMEGKAKGEDARPCPWKREINWMKTLVSGWENEGESIRLPCHECKKEITIKPDK